MASKVAIIGAGPGSADLLTVRAAEALRRAEVVLHDDLVSPDVLGLCSPSALVINVGKRCGKGGATQEQINALMIQHARQGRSVARLKSGDPAIFGRLGEELQALREAEIPFEIVPGITAVAAAAAAAEITLTDRRSASTLVLLPGHSAGKDAGKAGKDGGKDKDSDNDGPQPGALDAGRTTFVIYMPGPNYSRTARDLMHRGIDAATPCVVVSHAGRSNQQARFLLLSDLIYSRGIAAPAVLIVGRVAARECVAEGSFAVETALSSQHSAVTWF